MPMADTETPRKNGWLRNKVNCMPVFVLSTLAIYAYVFIKGNIAMFGLTAFSLDAVFATFAYVLVLTVVVAGLFAYAPRRAVDVIFAVQIFLSIFMIVQTWTIDVMFCFVMWLMTSVYSFAGDKLQEQVDIVCALFRDSASIFVLYALPLLAVQFVLVSVLIAHFLVMVRYAATVANGISSQIFHHCVFLHFFWCEYNVVYLMRTIAANLTEYYLKRSRKSPHPLRWVFSSTLRTLCDITGAAAMRALPKWLATKFTLLFALLIVGDISIDYHNIMSLAYLYPPMDSYQEPILSLRKRKKQRDFASYTHSLFDVTTNMRYFFFISLTLAFAHNVTYPVNLSPVYLNYVSGGYGEGSLACLMCAAYYTVSVFDIIEEITKRIAVLYMRSPKTVRNALPRSFQAIEKRKRAIRTARGTQIP